MQIILDIEPYVYYSLWVLHFKIVLHTEEWVRGRGGGAGGGGGGGEQTSPNTLIVSHKTMK